MSLPKELLEELYFERSLSMAQIAEHLRCSVNKVVYWMGGTYQDLSEYGTLTVGVSSTKLRETVLQWCEDYLNRYG